jgi:hypothetical protein
MTLTDLTKIDSVKRVCTERIERTKKNTRELGKTIS